MAKDSSKGFLGTPVPRRDARDKTTGRTRYTDDHCIPGMLYAAVVNSTSSHARISSIDTARARALPGVRGVFTGRDFPQRLGLYLGDKPALAVERVRYSGEPLAAVVADDEATARQAAALIRVTCEELPVVATLRQSLQPETVLLHPALDEYIHIPAIFPRPGTNIAHHSRIRKGDAAAVLAQAEVVVQGCFSFPPRDHLAMEPRVALARIQADGTVVIRTSTQSPYGVRGIMSRVFGIPPGKIVIEVAEVGGGFGGKAGIQLEPLAYLLSREMDGRPVRVMNSREQDMTASPGGPGLEATVKLGAREDGRLLAAEIEFLFDSGGYADYAVNVSRAAAYASTGPYAIPHVATDSYCVYTNHPFATAFRGFGHIELSFAVERALDLLAERLKMDPVELRRKNAVRQGDTTPAQDKLDANTGNLRECLDRVVRHIGWQCEVSPSPEQTLDRSGLNREMLKEHLVRARGVSCYWKAPAIPTFTDAGAMVTFNEDGSINVITGAVEMGQGIHTGLAQITAEALGMDLHMVHVVREVMTDRGPHDWTSAASRTLFMVGRAVLAAVEDAVGQIKRVASAPLRAPEEDLEVRGGRVFLRDDPSQGLPLAEVVLGYVYPNGNAIGGPVIGRGKYIARHLSHIDPETGAGRPGLEWTLGALGVEVEVDLRDGTFRVLKSVCSMDVGRVINPVIARGQVVGAMAMGIGYATRESFRFDQRERVINGTLRDYKALRFGEHPQYVVDFVETPQGDGPFGARGLGEQGIIGVPGAISSALSRAVGRQVDRLPLTPEYLWGLLKGSEADDTL
ncbi:xanthine dehydrogenase, molybdenum binding subunit apoprotein [Alkalispirochaeta americana]|uniref:Xanthine dehydrogenase, molybdenum binding subunit apoprotein n=1 Tax=Alkalispirochaeta americana TaxID=159291 RepID=A0A1N6U506_9SPIO|nr:xanthine dehydrogenase family protein molybdopterin-binding subunit [Alkalispirochaeta americana]SIQ60581.1 xanthine dehydrogenase, molybdenum binding subunit apoprotein [Alkalispirochaeta americana]